MAYAAAVAGNAKRALNRKPLIVPVRIPGDMAAKLDRAVSGLRYASRNEFIREAIEQHVNDRLGSKMIEVRDVSVKG
ncbi:MAG: ribbon-helix-helix domain-containing protein, partial [Nitrososphaerales archaeon]|nr:ribbon-helix-helix domain-containing protein [Nitrososphaerales archaeon]